ncbi:MAG: hypothetical protein KGI25_08245 [Thaumarchaeota archaeon]|nr:hypothetical protein [Nitrososphaerota archaeon]
MSLPTEPADNPKPVVKDKNPHNYRKVGYSMIIIAVSLVIIALLSWGLADNYHFSSNIMALQEVDAMTPKSGYNIVMFDISQPVGAKLKMLDHADALDQALSMQTQDAQQNQGNTIQVLLFNATKDYNLKLMQNAEVYIQTPKTGYNVILDNYPLAVGAQLTLASHEPTYPNATDYAKGQEDQIQGQQVKVLIFTPKFTDNLQMITNSSTPVGEYVEIAQQMANATQTTGNQTAPTVSANATNATSAQVPPAIPSNQTLSTSGNRSMTTSANNTTAPTMTNMTTTTNQTTVAKTNMTTTNQASTTPKTSAPATTAVQSNPTVVIANGASATKGSCTTTDCFNPQFITIHVGNTVTWTNADTVGHTATSGKLTDNQTGTVFDSGLISAGKSYTSPPFKTAGTYYYFCQVHPWMTGQITVSATSNPPSQNGTATTKTVTLNETMGVNATGK